MDDTLKKQLTALGPEVLADALLQLAQRVKQAEDVIHRLTDSSAQKISRFKKALARLKRPGRFKNWRETAAFAEELQDLLHGLEGLEAPDALSLLAAFYAADEALFRCCDDSHGDMGAVFHDTAQPLFVAHAARCTDKTRVRELLLKLTEEDPFDLRSALLHDAAQFLAPSEMMALREALQRRADGAPKYERLRALLGVAALARQLGDGEGYAQARLACFERPDGQASEPECLEIARVFLETGDPTTAMQWVAKHPQGAGAYAGERHALLADIYKAQGDHDALKALAYQAFKRRPCKRSLDEYVALAGEDARPAVVAAAVAAIVASASFEMGDALFLFDLDDLDTLDAYLLDHADELWVFSDQATVALAENLTARQRNVSATLLYRYLLNEVLQSAKTKAYPHGRRYLKALDDLAPSLPPTPGVPPHTAYMAGLRADHGLKYSFWSAYRGPY